jgi:hypothetical protein
VGLREAFLIPVALALVMVVLAPSVRDAARGPRPSSMPETDAPLV